MNISESEVKRIVKLIALSFSEEDFKLYQKYLINVVALFDKLKEVNTDGIEPLYNTINDNLMLKEDKATKENSRDDLMKNVPKSKYSFFVVPKMIE